MKKIIPIIMIIALLFSGCKNVSSTNIVGDNQPGQSDVYIMAGKVQSNEEVNLTSKISGKVSGIALEAGAKVNAGDPIIYLDASDVQAQVAQAQAAVNTSYASLQKIQSGTRPEQIEQANASLQSAKAVYDNAKSNLERIEALFEQGTVSKQTLETAQAQFEAANSQYTGAQKQVDILNSGETKEALNVAESQVRQSQAALNLAQTQLKNVVITSPISGTISVCNIKVGELASPGQTLVTVVNPDNLYVNAYAPSSISSKINVGDRVVIKISEVPDKKFEGEIMFIEPEVDPKSKSTIVKTTINDTGVNLKPGMFAKIALKN